jgi:RND family efflux transporter MFP subunit
MKLLRIKKRTLAILGIGIPLLVLFVYVALRSGPLAPVPVILTTIEIKHITPALFGIGTVEARYTHKIGPTVTGRVKRLDAHVGDRVKAGQILGEIDSIDLDERIHAQDAASKKAGAQLEEADTRREFAQTQVRRYEKLLTVHSVSEEIVFTKQHELNVAEAGLNVARNELARIHAEREALVVQLSNLKLISPVDGMVVAREVDPGTTVSAGQTVVELIDPKSLWINVRFDQIHTHGLAADLSALIVLRSQGGVAAGHVFRVEPLADPVTEETLAKVLFDQLPDPLPPIGELVEVTIELSPLPMGPVLPNAAIQHINGQMGVWQVIRGELHFTPVSLGIADLNGWIQVRDGLKVDDQVVTYSAKALTQRSRIQIVERMPGLKP